MFAGFTSRPSRALDSDSERSSGPGAGTRTLTLTYLLSISIYIYYIYHISTRLHAEYAAAAAEGGGSGEPRGGPAPAPAPATRVQTRGARGADGACPARPAAAPPPPAPPPPPPSRPEQRCGGAAGPDQAVAEAAHPQPQLSVSVCLGSSYASIKLPQTPALGSNPVIVCTPQNNVRYVLVFLPFSWVFSQVYICPNPNLP